MPLSASVFRRGGPKKELFEVINEDADEEEELDEKLAELDELLHLQKAGRELSAALWRPELCAAEMVKQRKQTARDMGFIRGRKIYLHIEEAVFLMDRGDLLLFVEGEQTEAQQQGEGAAGDEGGGEEETGDGRADGGGRRRRPLANVRLLSVQEAFEIMICTGVPLERYMLYCALSRSGYLVMRHPSRWLLRREERPDVIWGAGAWAQCYGREPSVPGSAQLQPLQQQLPPFAAPLPSHGAASTSAAAAAVAPTAGAGPMEVDPLPASSAAGTAGARGGGSVSPSRQQQPAQAAGVGAGAAAAAASGCRGWWRAAGPDHPHLSGVPGSFFDELPPAHVQERVAAGLRASFPNLRPLPTIRSALPPAIPPPSTSIPCAHTPPSSSAANPSSPPSSSNISTSPLPASLACLGTPGACAHLTFDVYKPGSFVSRYKGHFPTVHTHVAMSSEAPPSLGEMRAADAAAAAAAGGGGEGGRPAGVTWVAVLNGDIALYSVGEADLLQLM